MIRHNIMVKFKEGATEEQIGFLEAFWTESRSRYKGLLGVTFGRDLGLREGNMTIAGVFDFEDEAAFRAFDTEEYHNEVRRQLAAGGVEQITRCQFRL